MLDLAIVGAGPAGITAGIYAARKGMEFALLTRDIGGQAAWTSDIENYVGYRFISGPDLIRKFEEHLRQYRFDFRQERVSRVKKESDGVRIEFDRGTYRSRAAIIASGRTPLTLGVEGEDAFRNRGVAFCATCDGPLFAGKDVAVVGGGNSGLYAALELLKFARRISLIEAGSKLTGDAVMQKRFLASGKADIRTGARVQRIAGGQFVEELEILREGKREILPVSGVFVEIGSRPNSEIAEDVRRTDSGEIVVDCSCQTSVPGIFAAGDVTTVFAKQIVTACGEGAKAAIAAFRYVTVSG